MPRTALFLFVVFPVLSFFRYMYGYVVEYLQPYREHSTAQHSTAQSPLHKAANQVRADQSTYRKKYVRTRIRRPRCFPGA